MRLPMTRLEEQNAAQADIDAPEARAAKHRRPLPAGPAEYSAAEAQRMRRSGLAVQFTDLRRHDPVVDPSSVVVGSRSWDRQESAGPPDSSGGVSTHSGPCHCESRHDQHGSDPLGNGNGWRRPSVGDTSLELPAQYNRLFGRSVVS